jgi:hypothetical protein
MPFSSPTQENADDDKNAEGDGPNNAGGNKVEPDEANDDPNENKGDGSKTATESHDGEGLKVDSSIVYPKPSTSTKSAQASSTQESTHDSEGIPEAEAGGPDILSVFRPPNSQHVLEYKRKSLLTCRNLILRVLFDSCFQRNKAKPPLRVSVLPLTLHLQIQT